MSPVAMSRAAAQRTGVTETHEHVTDQPQCHEHVPPIHPVGVDHGERHCGVAGSRSIALARRQDGGAPGVRDQRVAIVHRQPVAQRGALLEGRVSEFGDHGAHDAIDGRRREPDEVVIPRPQVVRSAGKRRRPGVGVRGAMASLGLDRVGKLAADLEHVSLVVALPTSHDDIVGATPILEPMSDYRPPLRDIRFTLDHIARLDEIVGWAGFEHVTPEVTERILDEAGRFMADIVAPLDRIGDIEGATRHPDGSVTLPDGFRDAYSRYVAGQWNAVKSPAEYGGHGFPEVMGLAVQEMLTGACMAFSLCPMLTQSAALLVERHGSDEQKAGYLPNLISGRWTGTMVLSEPQAGSDLGAVRTRAEPHQDGTWRINGSKIFITWGEHDLAENIIHFVLARAPDSPPGTRGLSLFMVPKFLPTPDGKPGVRNEVECVSIEHKVGIHASPTCVMSFGQDVGATGYLLGNLHQGIRAMFTMMNDARLNVGLEGLGTTERVLQQAGDFASERRQGRAPAGVDAVPIVEHPDVRRMLATIRAHSEAMRGLLYDNAARFDAEHHHGDPDHASRAGAVGRLLTPVSKAWCTDLAVEMASLGIQVHGGMGYVEETGAAATVERLQDLADIRGNEWDSGNRPRNAQASRRQRDNRALVSGGDRRSGVPGCGGRLVDDLHQPPRRVRRPGSGDGVAARGARPRGQARRRLALPANVRHGCRCPIPDRRRRRRRQAEQRRRPRRLLPGEDRHGRLLHSPDPARSQSPRACRHRRHRKHRKPGKWRRFCHTRAMTFDTAPRAAAFFDLDRTIISGSSVFTFGYVAYRNGMLPRSDLIKDLVSAILFQFTGASDEKSEAVKNRILDSITGLRVDDLRHLGGDIIPRLLDGVRRESRGLIDLHHDAGRDTFIVSASPIEIIADFSAALGMSGALGTVAEVVDGIYTGDLAEPFCYGEGKAIAIEKVAAANGYDLALCYAYSDSASDLPMLEAVGPPGRGQPRPGTRSRGIPSRLAHRGVQPHSQARDHTNICGGRNGGDSPGDVLPGPAPRKGERSARVTAALPLSSK